ncbi:MAG TPA: hypothetical protein VHZ09_14310 [Acidobacteriaceae bacterium]|jgi:hypothetical protein|nr:hypothetical protein [Acidobacteriaceae bacterium]
MVNHCYNSACGKELLYLREGRVVRIVHGEGEEATVEHFWLCGSCSERYEFVFSSDGAVTLGSRSRWSRPANVLFKDDVVLEWPIRSGE